MEGSSSSPGVTVRAVRYLFAAAAKLAAAIAAAGNSGGRGAAAASPPSFSFAVSMMEVHNERVRDLLAGAGPAQLALAQAEVEAAAAGGGAMDGADVPLEEGSRAAPGAAAAPFDAAAWAGSLGSAAAARAAADVDPDNLHVRDGGSSGGVEVVGLTRLPVASAAAALAVARVGAARRAVGGHALNEASSRSHMIVRLWLVGPSAAASGGSGGGGSGFAPAHRQTVSACLNFVDLAGALNDREREGWRCIASSPSPRPVPSAQARSASVARASRASGCARRRPSTRLCRASATSLRASSATRRTCPTATRALPSSSRTRSARAVPCSCSRAYRQRRRTSRRRWPRWASQSGAEQLRWVGAAAGLPAAAQAAAVPRGGLSRA